MMTYNCFHHILVLWEISMKKNKTQRLISVISLVIATLCAMSFAGCNKDIIDELTGPTNKWCNTTVKMPTSNDSDSKLDIYCYYATQEKSVQIGNSSEKTTLKKGLNVVISVVDNTSDSTISEIFGTVTSGKKPYVLKTFEEGSSSMQVEDDNGNTKTLTLKKSVWNILYLANEWDSYSDSTVPFTKESGKYETVSDLKDKFSISKILKKLAANKLLELLGE